MSHRFSLRASIVAASFVIAGQTAFAQIPTANTWKASPLNYFGRFQGIGYSDGYHSCKGNECRTKKSWFFGEGVSSFYGEPSAPAPRSMWSAQPSYAQYQSHQQLAGFASGYEVEVNPGMALSPQPMHESLQPMVPVAPVPMSPLPTTPLRLQPAPSPPPVPIPSPSPSPSDMSPYEIPRPRSSREPETVQPLLDKPQARRVIPGTHSLMMSQGTSPVGR